MPPGAIPATYFRCKPSLMHPVDTNTFLSCGDEVRVGGEELALYLNTPPLTKPASRLQLRLQ